MPSAPRKVCLKSGCGKLTTGTYCEEHEAKRKQNKKVEIKKYDNSRGTAASRGYNYKWQQYSKQYRKDHPLCIMCEKEGKLSLAQCVDHIKAVSGPDDPLFWDVNNHQGLCTMHHSVKTISEDGGFTGKDK